MAPRTLPTGADEAGGPPLKVLRDLGQPPPWQRGTNENTNGLLRQYFPKGTDLGKLTALELDQIANELNDRPRKRLGFYKPTERLAELLLR